MAVLLGFADFADMSLARKMAPSVASVEKLLHTLKDAATDAALGDLIDLSDLVATNLFPLCFLYYFFYMHFLNPLIKQNVYYC